MEKERHISLYELQRLVKESLNEQFALPLWVAGEISELKVNYSGHCYIELIEKDAKKQTPMAKASAVVWRSLWGAISNYFASSTGSELSVGMKVLLKVNVTYHELYGLSLTVSNIDPLYTLGDMERERRETIERLQQEGVFDMNRELGLPEVIQRLAVVSSRNAAGYQDFFNELLASPYRFDVTLFDSFMQGAAAVDSVVDSLGKIAEDVENFDVVVIIRGGGSTSDLSCFDSYRLSSHLAQFPLPVITGIGHDKDQSVADLVAGQALKTPTAVATFLIERLTEFGAYIAELENDAVNSVNIIIEQERVASERLGYRLSQSVGRLARGMEMTLGNLEERISNASIRIVRRQSELLDKLRGDLTISTARGVGQERKRLVHFDTLVASHDPKYILEMGFSIVRKGDTVIKRSEQLTDGDMIEITFGKGSAEAEIKKRK